MTEERTQPSTHPGEALLLALVERLVEVKERGADCGGGGAHGGQALAHRLHAADRGERGLAGAGRGERVGGLERSGDELIEGDALRARELHIALDFAHRPVAQHAGKRLAAAAPAGRSLTRVLARRVVARSRVARCGVIAPAMPARGVVAALATRLLRLAASRRVRRVACLRRIAPYVAVEPRLLLVVERGVERLERGLDRVEGGERRGDALLHRLEPRRRRRRHVARALGREALARLLRLAAQRLERGALSLVGPDGAGDVVERPVRELRPLRGAAAHELVDRGAEGAVAAARQRELARDGGSTRGRRIVAVALAAAILLARAAPLVAIPAIAPPVAALAEAPPALDAAPTPAIVPRAVIATIARALLSEILRIRRAVLAAIIAASIAAVLAAIVVAGLSAVLALRLARAPLVEGGTPGGALAVAVIAVMAAAGVGARGHAHHQHRRNEHTRCPHGPRPPLVPAGTTREGGLGFGRCGGDELRHPRHPRA